MYQLFFVFVLFISCAQQKKMQVSEQNVKPGSKVTIGGKTYQLHNGNLKIGDNFVKKMKKTDIDFKFNNKVSIISIVPSVDTPVCEEQTHILGEYKGIDKNIDLYTLSRDLPMAQSRFAREAKLENITYLSDFKTASFGKISGLLIKDKSLLGRAIIVIDHKGIIRYLQNVPEITHLPDMVKAFNVANQLVKQ